MSLAVVIAIGFLLACAGALGLAGLGMGIEIRGTLSIQTERRAVVVNYGVGLAGRPAWQGAR